METKNLIRNVRFSFGCVPLILTLGGNAALLAFGGKAESDKHAPPATDKNGRLIDHGTGEASIIPAADPNIFGGSKTKTARRMLRAAPFTARSSP